MCKPCQQIGKNGNLSKTDKQHSNKRYNDRQGIQRVILMYNSTCGAEGNNYG